MGGFWHDHEPANVLVGADGRARVVDFGLARVGMREAIAEAGPQGVPIGGTLDGSLTGTGAISGTPGYMSPEQYRGSTSDSRSDQWSFAAALYEALYGRLPFVGKTLAELAFNVSGKLEPLPTGSPAPVEIYHILARALAAQPDERYPSMADLLHALGHEQGDSPAGGAMAQRRTIVTIVSMTVLLSALAVQRALRGPVLMGQTALTSLVLLCSGGLLCWAWRRTLLQNAFHRRLILIVMTTAAQNLAQRLVALKLGLSMYTLFPLEMIVWAGSITLIANWLLPVLRWLPAILLGLAGAAVLLPRTMAPVLGLAYPLLIITIAVAWTGASARAKAESKAVRAGQSAQWQVGQSQNASAAETPGPE